MKNAIKLLTAATFAAALLGVAGCKTAAPEKSAKIELFNGKNFDGWTFCMKNDADPMKTWSITHGMIRCTGRPFGYARTTQAYHDYKLTCIWRFVRVAPHADNSGIFVHIQPPDKVWPVCYECQGLYQHQGDIYIQPGAGADGHPAGRQAVLVPQMGPPNENPAGEWNTNQIVCNGDALGLFVNGKVMNQLSGCTIDSGYIGIQAEGGDIEVRKLTLEPLK